MEHINQQFLEIITRFLSNKGISLIFNHSMVFGLLTGVISLIPFFIKRVPHVVIMIIGFITIIYVYDSSNLDLKDMLYYPKMYLVVKFMGRYIIGFIYGLAIANLIQRIKGDHEHESNN